jgi:predicted enzyme related to lactoylglutathione lyase
MVGNLMEVILYVQDMQKQVKFYRDTLGLKVTYPQVADYSNEYWVEFDTGACTLALHGGGNGKIGEDAPRLVFKVEDINSARYELGERGVKLSEIREPTPNHFLCDATDPEGNHFSIEARLTPQISD